MNLIQQRDALVKSANVILQKCRDEGRKYPTEAEAAELGKISDQIDSVAEKIVSNERYKQVQDMLAKSAQIDDDGRAVSGDEALRAASASTWAKSVTSNLDRAARGVGVKALLSGEVNVPAAVGIVPLPEAPASLLGLVRRLDLKDGNVFHYLRQIVREDNAAVVPDNTLKPTSIYTFEEVEDKARVIAHLSEPFPIRYMDDYAGLAAILDAEMKEGIARAIEHQIVNGDGTGENFSGILTTSGVLDVAYTGSVITTLRRARTTLEGKGERLTAIAMNPADVEALDLTREDGTTGGFLLDQAAYDRILGPGVVGVPSLAVPVGTAIAGNWNSMALLVREDAQTLAATQAGDLFAKNQVMLRAEGRYGFQIQRPQALAVVDLTA